MGGDEPEKMGMSFERSIRGPVIKGGRTDKGSCKEWSNLPISLAICITSRHAMVWSAS